VDSTWRVSANELLGWLVNRERLQVCQLPVGSSPERAWGWGMLATRSGEEARGFLEISGSFGPTTRRLQRGNEQLAGLQRLVQAVLQQLEGQQVLRVQDPARDVQSLQPEALLVLQ
jgi:hypothetical protein